MSDDDLRLPCLRFAQPLAIAKQIFSEEIVATAAKFVEFVRDAAPECAPHLNGDKA